MKKLVFFLLFLCCTTYFSFSQLNYFEYLNMSDGLSNYTVNDFFQDEYGRMWIATREGLNCYDGNRFHVWKEGDGLSNNYISAIVGDYNNHLLIRFSRTLMVMNLVTDHLQKINLPLVRSVYGSDGVLSVAGPDTIYTLSFDANDSVLIRPMLTTPDISTFIQPEPHIVWVASSAGVWQYINGERSNRGIPQLSHVVSLYQDRHNAIWCCTQNDGLYCLDQNNQVKHYVHNSKSSNSIPDNDVRCIVEDRMGTCWIGCYAGLCRFNSSDSTFYRYEYAPRADHSLSTFSVRALTCDTQGTVWVGTFFGGINLINPSFSTYTFYGAYGNSDYRLSNPIVTRTCTDHVGNIWVGTNGGGVNLIRHDSNQIVHIPIDHITPQVAVKAMLLDETRKQLYVGTHRGGLKCIPYDNQFRIGPVQTFTFPDNSIREIIQQGDSLFILAQRQIYLFSLSDHRWSKLIAEEMPNITGEMNDMFLHNDTLWFAHNKMIYAYTLRTHRLHEYTLPSNAVLLCYSDLLGFLIGTEAQGVLRFEGGKFTPYKAINNLLPNLQIVDVAVSGGTIVVATQQGVSILYYGQNDAIHLICSQGFPLEAIMRQSISISAEQQVLVGGLNGLTVFPLKQVNTTYPLGKIYISDLSVNNQKVPSVSYLLKNPCITLSPGQTSFSVTPAAGNYLSQFNRTLYFRLKGLEDQWSVNANYSPITYTNLSKGTYYLQFTYDTSQDPTEFEVVVLPRWYQTWLAYMLFIIIIIGVFFVALAQYTRRIQTKTKKELEVKYQQEIQKVTGIVMNHLADSDFNIQHFAEEMCMSRTGLYAKMQEILGQTPNEFIMNIRMREAGALLRQHPTMSIVEISEMVGFNSSSYFIKCFQRFYRKSPSVWRKKNTDSK